MAASDAHDPMVDLSSSITLSRYLLDQHRDDPGLTILFASIQLACKSIASAVRKAGISGLLGLAGSVNATGDDQKALDIFSHDAFVHAVSHSREMCVLVSEEADEAIVVEEALSGRFCVVTDPLDGSSNIDCNVSTGTIFGIYEKTPGPGSVEDVLRPGNELIAAGYCMYGSSTQLVITTGHGVNGFTLDPSIGEFILTHPMITIPSKPKTILSVNLGNSCYFDAATKAFTNACLAPTAVGGKKPYSMRYVGSMVSDVHRTLLYGGIFMYPADSKSTRGKLRVLYEANPMSFICEQAGGVATDGRQRILDIVPDGIHCRTGIFIGCKRDVENLNKIYTAWDAAGCPADWTADPLKMD